MYDLRPSLDQDRRKLSRIVSRSKQCMSAEAKRHAISDVVTLMSHGRHNSTRRPALEAESGTFETAYGTFEMTRCTLDRPRCALRNDRERFRNGAVDLLIRHPLQSSGPRSACERHPRLFAGRRESFRRPRLSFKERRHRLSTALRTDFQSTESRDESASTRGVNAICQMHSRRASKKTEPQGAATAHDEKIKPHGREDITVSLSRRRRRRKRGSLTTSWRGPGSRNDCRTRRAVPSTGGRGGCA